MSMLRLRKIDGVNRPRLLPVALAKQAGL